MSELKRYLTDGEALARCQECLHLGRGKHLGDCTMRRTVTTVSEHFPIWAVPECVENEKRAD